MNLQEKGFHGSSGYASLLTRCISGKGTTECLYDRLPIENNRECNDTRTSEHMLRLKDVVTCDEGMSSKVLRIVISDKH
jgi:hypothetical protein